MLSHRSSAALAVVLPVAGAVLAASPASATEGATIKRGFVCAIPVSGVPLEGGAVFTRDSTSVVTPSGRAVLVCHGSLPDGMRVPQSVTEGSRCGIAEGISDAASRVVVSSSGRVSLTCKAVGKPAGS